MPSIVRTILCLALTVPPIYPAAAASTTSQNRFDDPQLAELNTTPELLISATKDYAEFVGDLSDSSLRISSINDYVIFQADRHGEELLPYACHFHEGGDYHCSQIDASLISDDKLTSILEISNDQMLSWMEGMSSLSSSDPSLWVWVAVGTVTFYIAKKAINRIALGQFLAPAAHAHSHFFASKNSLEKQTLRSTQALSEALPRLETIAKQLSDSTSPKSTPEEINSKVQEEISRDIKAIVHQLIHAAAGKTCSHDHHHESHGTDSCKKQKEAAKSVLASGAIVRFAETMTIDFYREFVRPVKFLAKSTYNLLFNRWNAQQVGSLIRVETQKMRAETNLPFAVALLSGLVGLKAFGEFLESLVVGPYHAFCQVTDAAVLVAGMSVWGSYHCLRQAQDLGDIKNLTKPIFWQAILSSFRQRLKGATATSDTALFSEDEQGWSAYFLSLRFMSREMKSLIRKKDSIGDLSNEQSKKLARWLGLLNRSLEDQSFVVAFRSIETLEQKAQWQRSVNRWLHTFESIVQLSDSWDSKLEEKVESYFLESNCVNSLLNQGS